MSSGFDTPGTTSVMSAVTVPTATLQGGVAATATSGTFTTTISYYTYVSRREGYANGSTYLVSKKVCKDARSATLTQFDASSAETDSTASASIVPVATPAFTVDAYVKVGNTAASPTISYLVKAGAATKISTSTTATAAAPCAGITTETWSYTLNPGTQRVLLPFPTAGSAGTLHFVAKGATGQWILGPAGTYTYAP